MIRTDRLDDVDQMALWDGDLFGIEFPDDAVVRMDPGVFAARKAKTLEQGEEVLLHADMGVLDSQRYDNFVKNEAFVGGRRAPATVKAPSTVQEERLAGVGEQWIENMFRMFGTKPSNVIRTRYARIRVWEVFADFYLYATPARRAELVSYAAKADIPPKVFMGFVDKSMRRRGLSDLPKVPAKVDMSVAEIEQLAVAKGIDDTRNLFFDLSKRGNWADASKLAFPFADAWWEVMTRWGRLMNPWMADEFGQPFRNVRRIGQATTGGEQNGWFELDENGDRVFRWFPGNAMVTGMMGLAPGMELRNTASVNQLGFIDFSDTRGIMGPGTGPYLQLLASFVRPFMPGWLRDASDWAVFGSWDPREHDANAIVDTLLPSYMRKGFNRITNGMEDERFAGIQVELANARVAVDPEYADAFSSNAKLEKLMMDTRSTAGRLGFVEIIASWFMPVQPRLVVEAMNNNTEGSDEAINLMGMALDYNFLSQHFEREQVRQMVAGWYGFNDSALDRVAYKTYRVVKRPSTKEGGRWLEEHADAETHLPYTVEALIPESLEDTFYGPAREASIEEGKLHRNTLREALLVNSYNQGTMKLHDVQTQKNERLLAARRTWGADSEEYKTFRDDVVTPWYNNARKGVATEFYGFSVQGTGPPGLPKRPVLEELRDEMLAAGTIGEPANAAVRNWNPELADALQFVAYEWETLSQASLSEGRSAEWWYSGSAQRDQTAALLRGRFQQSVAQMTRDLDPQTQREFKWYADNVISPALRGVSLDNPFIVEFTPLALEGSNG
jgi:hypothetical protein